MEIYYSPDLWRRKPYTTPLKLSSVCSISFSYCRGTSLSYFYRYHFRLELGVVNTLHEHNLDETDEIDQVFQEQRSHVMLKEFKVLNRALHQTQDNRSSDTASMDVDRTRGINNDSFNTYKNNFPSTPQTGDAVEENDSIDYHQSASTAGSIESLGFAAQSFSGQEKQTLPSKNHRRTIADDSSWKEANKFPSILAVVDVEEWQVNPVDVCLGQSIGKGYWGSVHRSLVKSAAVKTLKNLIHPSLRDKQIFAAVKILKGLSHVVLF